MSFCKAEPLTLTGFLLRRHVGTWKNCGEVQCYHDGFKVNVQMHWDETFSASSDILRLA